MRLAAGRIALRYGTASGFVFDLSQTGHLGVYGGFGDTSGQHGGFGSVFLLGDQHPFPGTQSTQVDQVGPHRKPGFGHARRLLRGHAGRHGQHMARRGLAELRIAAPGRQGADRLP